MPRLNRSAAVGAVLASAVALVLGCGDATAPICPSVPLTVSVTSGTRPTFMWTPNCVAEELVVYEVRQPWGGHLAVWVIAARTSGVGTGSPVTYGRVPFRMLQTTGPLPLVAGRTYRVSILNGSSVEMGSKIFGP